ncbi:MAG: acyl-CoA thioesterase-1 [Bacteroidia bacterium]|jgi:acyl-CoA thioesterase-1
MSRFSYFPKLVRSVLSCGCFLIALLAPSFSQASTILVVGDSISAAYGMSLEQGWVAAMDKALALEYPDHDVINASISGETSGGALSRMPRLLAQHKPALVIIELGGNDGLRGYPLKNFHRNLESLVTLSQRSGARVILVPMEIPPNYGTRYTAGFRQAYRDVASSTGCVLAPFILDGVATDPDLMQTDGIHPTAAAQPLLLQNILPTVLTVLETP